MIRTLLVCFPLLLAALRVGPAKAQSVCAGDLDGDGTLTSADLELVRQLLVDEERALLLGYLADVNNDGVLTAADLVALVRQLGRSCLPPTATPRPSSTATATATATQPVSSPSPTTPARTATPTPTRTRTSTPTVTPTPTPVCAVQTLSAGSVLDGSLGPSDCSRFLAGVLRFVDVYQVSAPAGTALRVEVTGLSNGLTSPWVAVDDPNGQFGFAEGTPPVEWSVVPGQPYLIYVTSHPGQPQQTGAYRIRVTTRACPTPRTIDLTRGFSMSNLRLSSSDCADPVSFGTNGKIDPAHVYTFQVSSVPTQVDIVMRQLVEDDPLDPTFVVLGPDGLEAVPSDQVDDAAGGPIGVDAGARFLAIRPGTYTLIVGGGEGRYSLVVSSPRCPATTVNNIPVDRPLVCPGEAGPGCQGTLYGSRTNGTCGAPLPVFADEEAPQINAGAKAYTFTAQRGELVSVGVEVDGDEAYALLLGPASEGNPIVGYDSSTLSGADSTQLSATVLRSGSYTLLLGNVNPLAPPDLSAGDPGDVLPYRYYLQKCLPGGVVTPGSAQELRSTFRVSDCWGSGQTPHRIYVVPGQAGQFLMVEMEGDEGVDPALKLWAPDGSVSDNDDDPFGSPQVARVARVLPEAGDYLLEVYASPNAGELDTSVTNAFSVRARTCPTQGIRPGLMSLSFGPQDCKFGSGQPFKALTWSFSGGAPQVASFTLSDGVCAQALLPTGEAIPAYSCAANLLEVPMIRSGTYALVVAPGPGEALTPFVLSMRQCALTGSVAFADRVSGTLSSANCLAADGVRADWYWLAAGENLLRFNEGMAGTVESTFRVITGLTDALGTAEGSNVVSVDPSTMLRGQPGQRGALVRLRSAGASAGPYRFIVDPAVKRR
ncbi:MAG: dockerin type I repeat-containing protein [Candidatus Binatia bacterium]|nr:dockerin type I repeat-containing protein [Candidatus Binatia bacterium]